MLKECSSLVSWLSFSFISSNLKVQYFLRNSTIYSLYFSATLMAPASMSCECPTTFLGPKIVSEGWGATPSCSGWFEASWQEPPAMFRAQGERSKLMKANLFPGDGGEVDQGPGQLGHYMVSTQILDAHGKHLSSTRKACCRKFIRNHPCRSLHFSLDWITSISFYFSKLTSCFQKGKGIFFEFLKFIFSLSQGSCLSHSSVQRFTLTTKILSIYF